MEYREPAETTRSELGELLAAQDHEAAAEALIARSLDDDDAWVQERAVTLVTHASPEIRAAAVTAIGHVARLHPELPSGAAAEAARRAGVPAGRAEDTLDDIATFSHDQRGGPVP